MINKVRTAKAFPDLSKVRNGNLTLQQKLKKLTCYRAMMKEQRLKILNLSKQVTRMKVSKQKLSSKIAENTKRGDVGAICYYLNQAYEKGLTSSKSKILKFMKNIAQNFNKKSPRYCEITKKFYDAVRIVGGPRTSRLIASNLMGPSDETQRRSRKHFVIQYHPEGLSENTFQYAAEVYRALKDKYQIEGDVLVQTAEDETSIISKSEWSIKFDEVWGWCGKEEENHRCDPSFVHKVGSDATAYDRLQAAFQCNRAAGLARVVMLNPLHKDLPSMVILLQATCNKFDHNMVKHQWEEIQLLYNKHLLSVLGPLVGNGSDGDSRRRKLHIHNALDANKDSQRYKLPHENFTMSGKIVQVEGKSIIENLSDQDYIHNGKKMVNHLKHASRLLYIGENLCHMNHLQLLYQNNEISRMEHGLQQQDIDRQDRMNWESAQRALFPKVRTALKKINDGEVRPQENVSGTIVYLRLVWHYVELFYSLEASLLERVKYASYVANFLRIWRGWIHQSESKTLRENFVSRETYQDIILSCHHVVLIIMASRDFASNHPACLQKLGTDCCEEYFSSNGSFVINKHNYTIMDMFNNLSNMNYLERLFADKEGPENPKKHRKGENIWHKGHKVETDKKPDLKQYPTNDDMVRAWEEGIRMSQRELTSCGVGPANADENDDKNAWFYYPHTTDKNIEKEIKDLMHEEESEVENEDSDLNEESCSYSSHEDSISMDTFSELGLHLRSLADQLEEDTVDQTSQTEEVKLTVNVPGVGEVHKSTLVGMLNQYPTNISTDRLKRVKSRVTISASENIDGNEIALFDDAAIYTKDLGKKATFIRSGSRQGLQVSKTRSDYSRKATLNEHVIHSF